MTASLGAFCTARFHFARLTGRSVVNPITQYRFRPVHSSQGASQWRAKLKHTRENRERKASQLKLSNFQSTWHFVATAVAVCTSLFSLFHLMFVALSFSLACSPRTRQLSSSIVYSFDHYRVFLPGASSSSSGSGTITSTQLNSSGHNRGRQTEGPIDPDWRHCDNALVSCLATLYCTEDTLQWLPPFSSLKRSISFAAVMICPV